MTTKKNLRKGKKIAPSNVWDMLSLMEKKKAKEVLIQVAEEVMVNHNCKNSPEESPEEFVINDDVVH